MNNSLKKVFVMLLIIIGLLIVGSLTVCAENTEFSFEKTSVNMELNSYIYLDYNNEPSGSTIIWSSSDKNVASVDDFGKIEAKNIGTATITATADDKIATCEVTVIYGSIVIESNQGKYEKVNLIMEEHPEESLKATIYDANLKKIENTTVEWESSDSNIVSVDNNGKIQAKGIGTATITATAVGVKDTCEVTVCKAPEFTDFSKAKYELLFDISVDLKITGINPKNFETSNYYYIITSSNNKPTIKYTNSGFIDFDENPDLDYLSVNKDEKYLFKYYLDEYVELNQDLYLWLIEDVKLTNGYYNENSNYITHSTKFLVEGEKLTRPELPKLNLIMKSVSIGDWTYNNGEKENYTSLWFRFPSAVENRKFKIKIGIVTDNSILKKIQNNDYSGITELLKYAKNNDAIFSSDLRTTSENYFKSEKALFNGRELLKNKQYYYIYVEFDNENGKYIPIEGITLGQAWFSETSNNWGLWAYTSEEFKWNDLSSGDVKKDDTISQEKLPAAGINKIWIICIILVILSLIFFKYKNIKYKEIK